MQPVKPKPIYRSLTFWSGILVMGFIVWAWRDSTRRSISLDTGKWRLLQWASGIAFSYHPFISSGSQVDESHMMTITSFIGPLMMGEEDALSPEQEKALLESMRLARPEYYRLPGEEPMEVLDVLPFVDPGYDPAFRYLCAETSVRGSGFLPPGAATPASRGWICFIPHWLLLLAFALPWSGALLWRARRHRRNSQAIPSAP